jgi:hypothetical protein
MKNRAGIGVVLVVLASLSALTATEPPKEKSGKVEMKDDFIVVHPGTKLSRADTQALNDVLKKYDKSLYKIQIYKNGKVTKTLGTLNDMYIDQRAVADLAEAKTSGQSERAIQLIAPAAGPQKGVTANPQRTAMGQPMPTGPQQPPSPMPTGPQQPPSPMPTGPQQPPSPMPTGPQQPPSPMPTGPQQPTSPTPTGPQRSPSSPVNPQRSSTQSQQANEFMQRLKPILEKYSR